MENFLLIHQIQEFYTAGRTKTMQAFYQRNIWFYFFIFYFVLFNYPFCGFFGLPLENEFLAIEKEENYEQYGEFSEFYVAIEKDDEEEEEGFTEGYFALFNFPFCELLSSSIEDEEEENYEQYGEFADMMKEFNDAIETENEKESHEGRGLFSWGKNIKNWFKNLIKNMVFKFLDLKDGGDVETCAYNFAQIKRKVDKVYKTGSVKKILKSFDNVITHKDPRLEYFKERIYYYCKHKNASPKRSLDQRYYGVSKENPLRDVDAQYIFGGLEVACGFLIGILPFPCCQTIGITLIGDGCIRMGYQFYEDYDKKNGNNRYDF